MNKNQKQILTIFVMIFAAIILLVGFATVSGYLSFAIPPLPTAVYNGAVLPIANTCNSPPCSAGLLENQNPTSTSFSYVYPYEYCNYVTQGTTQTQICPVPGFTSTLNPSIYIASSSSSDSITASDNNDTAQIAAFSQLLNQTQATLNSGGAGNNGGQYSAGVADMRQQITILEAAIVYNNGLAQGLATSTTTIPTTIHTAPIVPPQLYNFWNGIISFFQNLVKQFNLELPLSVGVQQNFTVSQAFPVEASVLIPTQWQTQNFTVSQYVTRIQYTYCSPFVTNNQSVSLFEGTPTLVVGSTYNVNFSYTPTSRQLLIAGAVCKTTNSTYSFASGNQSAWSTFLVVANQSATVHAGVNVVKPNILQQFWSGITTFFASLFKNFGL